MEAAAKPIQPAPVATGSIAASESNQPGGVKNGTNSPQQNVPKLDFFDAIAQPAPPTRDRSLLMPFAELVTKLADYPKQRVDPESGSAMTIEQVTVDMPVQLNVTVNPDGTVSSLRGSPPTQLVKTTIMPVFHHMRIRIVREDGE